MPPRKPRADFSAALAGASQRRCWVKCLLCDAEAALDLSQAASDAESCLPTGMWGVTLRAAQRSKDGSQQRTWTSLLACWGCKQVV